MKKLFIIVSIIACCTTNSFSQYWRNLFDIAMFQTPDTLEKVEKKIPLIRFFNDGIFDEVLFDSIVSTQHQTKSDSLLLTANPFTIPLVYHGKELLPLPNTTVNYSKLLKNDTIVTLKDYTKPREAIDSRTFIKKLRREVGNYIVSTQAELYYTTDDQLPPLSSFTHHAIPRKPLTEVRFTKETPKIKTEKISVTDPPRPNWTNNSYALFQFTQNHISKNWYKGGNSNLAFLTIFSGKFNYSNLKNIQWDNFLEWRSGFNSVEGDTLHRITTNADVLRYNTKFGIKAFGSWYYSVAADIATQLYNNYKGINSNELKATFLSPVRTNLGLGMDYKYKKIFSLMIAPLSYKFVYDNDTAQVNPNLFGIETGKNKLSQIGSSLKAQLSYSPMLEWQIDSRLNFYTNYEKIEVDWEIISNYSFNRFFSVRLSLNPRYDNTVITKDEEKAKIQFKQLLSIGLSYRLI